MMYIAGQRFGVKANQVLLERLGLRDDFPSGPSAKLEPSNTRLSFPPTWFTNATGTRYLRGDGLASISRAQFALAQVKRRRRDVQQDLSARSDQVFHGIDPVQRAVPEMFVVPGILANGQGELFAIQRQTTVAARRARSFASRRRRRSWVADVWTGWRRSFRHAAAPPSSTLTCRWPNLRE